MKNTLTLSFLFISFSGVGLAQGRFAAAASSAPPVAVNTFDNNVRATPAPPREVTAPVNTRQATAASVGAAPVNASSFSQSAGFGGQANSPAAPVASLPVNSGAQAMATIALPRYNQVTHITVPYYSNPTTQYKRFNYVGPRVKKHHECTNAPAIYFAEQVLFYTYGYIFDDFEDDFYDDGSYSEGGTWMDNSVYNTSFDGYVVYGSDTLQGIVTPTKNVLVMEEPLDGLHELSGVYSYDDKKLKMVAIFEGNRELYFSRPTQDGKLLRVIHAGKLNVYDDHYSFLTTSNVNKGKLTLVYNGTVVNSKTYLASDGKRLLTEYANKAYGLNLAPGEFTWEKLLLYIDKLN